MRFKEAVAWSVVEEVLTNLSSEAVGVDHTALSCGIRGRWLRKPLLDIGEDSIPVDLVNIYTWVQKSEWRWRNLHLVGSGRHGKRKQER